MLIHASARDGAATVLPGGAHVVISIDAQSGGLRMQSYLRGERDASYVSLSVDRLPAALAALLAELQSQLS